MSQRRLASDRARLAPPAWAVWGLLLGLVAGCRSAVDARLGQEGRAGDVRLRVTELEDLSRARDVFRSARGVYSSTDRGLYVYPTSGPPRAQRLGLAAGLPSDDVLATRLLPDDSLAVLTARGLVSVTLRPSQEDPAELPAAPLGPLFDIEVYDGLLYACGEHGLARLEGARGWAVLSDLPGGGLPCRSLVSGQGDTLWVLGDDALTQLVGDELREHRAPAFPAGRPRAVAEAASGDVYVLLEREEGGVLARYTDGAWWTYGWSPATTARQASVDAESAVVGLVAQAGVPLLVTGDTVLALVEPGRGAVTLEAHERSPGRPLLSRVSPGRPRASVPPSRDGQRARSAPLPPATLRTPSLPAAPRLAARALPHVAVGVEAAFASDSWVYLAVRGRGLLEVGETRRPLSAGDFREARPLAVAVDARGGTWVRADDGSLVRVEGGVARVYPHGRASALLEAHDTDGAARRGEVWAALMGPGGEALLVVPEPSGWVERARLSPDEGLTDVRLGVRGEDDHLWLFAHGQRPEWSAGAGLLHRDPAGSWTFVDVPLQARGALEAVTHLVGHGDVCFAAGPDGLARVPAHGAATRLFDRPVSDVERSGARLAFVSHGTLWELDAHGSADARPRNLRFEEDPAEALRRVNASGLALAGDTVSVVGEGGMAFARLGSLGAGPLLSPDVRWWALEREGPALLAHDVEAAERGAWVARRDGALWLLDPR